MPLKQALKSSVWQKLKRNIPIRVYHVLEISEA